MRKRRIFNILLLFFIYNEKWGELYILLELLQRATIKKGGISKKEFLYILFKELPHKKIKKAYGWLLKHNFIKEDGNKIQPTVADGIAYNIKHFLAISNLEDSKYLQGFNVIGITEFRHEKFKKFKQTFNLSPIEALQFSVRNYFEWNFLKERVPRWALSQILGISKRKQRKYESLRFVEKKYNYKHKPLKGNQQIANTYINTINLGVFKQVSDKKSTRWLARLLKKIRSGIVGLRMAEQNKKWSERGGVLSQDSSSPAIPASIFEEAFQIQSSVVETRKKIIKESKSHLVKREYHRLEDFIKFIHWARYSASHRKFLLDPLWKSKHLAPVTAYFIETLAHKLKVYRGYYLSYRNLFPRKEREFFDTDIKLLKSDIAEIRAKIKKAKNEEERSRLKERYLSMLKSWKTHFANLWREFADKAFDIKASLNKLIYYIVRGEIYREGIDEYIKEVIPQNYKWFWMKDLQMSIRLNAVIEPNILKRLSKKNQLKVIKEYQKLGWGLHIEKMYSGVEERKTRYLYKIPLFRGVTPDFWSIHYTLATVKDDYRSIAKDLLQEALIEREKAFYNHPAFYRSKASKELAFLIKKGDMKKIYWQVRNAIITRFGNSGQYKNEKWKKIFQKLTKDAFEIYALTRFLTPERPPVALYTALP